MPEPRTREVQAECVNKRLTSVGAVPSSERRPSATCSGCERRPSPRKRSGAGAVDKPYIPLSPLRKREPSPPFCTTNPVGSWQCTATRDLRFVVHADRLHGVSSADERQSVDLQRDVLIAAGVDERHLHQDRASGARDDRPGLKDLPCRSAAW